ncbi:MAG TPA: helix-turn-helix domain-containing protein [Chlamydiales bacterium]|nr:helix-turn-helix domain-containing protein [Chlamydiales bacterium]
MIERIIVVHQERLIEKKDIPLQIDTDLPPIISENHTTIKDLERAHILKTLKAYANNQSQAAKALGITARTLRNKMKSYFSKID